jgi:hypothetical protein
MITQMGHFKMTHIKKLDFSQTNTKLEMTHVKKLDFSQTNTKLEMTHMKFKLC